jgi:hypothetical protein
MLARGEHDAPAAVLEFDQQLARPFEDARGLDRSEIQHVVSRAQLVAVLGLARSPATAVTSWSPPGAQISKTLLNALRGARPPLRCSAAPLSLPPERAGGRTDGSEGTAGVIQVFAACRR